ncbi:FAD-binding oxidoreductase [Chromobacterium phragmitis]|uniref:FAD-binding FR-type domain-containing protein n=1 Tax=Chromobacterium phragmitis TaxID=2202141 RepID=A0A344UJ06_9NEIS|nr:FAD-binding oxidoreductase [Chromobacterium phragmitis]AXE35254.1 hypothetical protein DK843_13705 [Chromobacterium phragmitis]
MSDHYFYTVSDIQPLGPQALRLSLRADDGRGMPIRAGQFFSLRLPDGAERSYSLACAPRADGGLEAQIRLRDGGRCSEWLRREALPGQRLRLTGPYGDCVWQPPAPEERVLMLATGTGIAPLYAMLAELDAGGGDWPEIDLYWGTDRPEALYLEKELAALAARRPTLRFIPVLAAAPADWVGERGRVQHAAADRHPDLSRARVYACGAPAMVDEARRLLTESCGLPEARFHADAFAPAQPIAASGAETLAIRWRREDGQWLALPAAAGSRLADALAAAGLVLPVCGGQAACGVCRVAIAPDWLERLPEPARREQRLLAALDAPHPRHRLACQITLHPGLNGLQAGIRP